jgi:hypothetical protein
MAIVEEPARGEGHTPVKMFCVKLLRRSSQILEFHEVL